MSWASPIPGAKWVKDLQAAEWQTEPPSPLGATSTFESMAVARERYRGWPPIPKAFEPGHLLINGWLYMRVGGPIWTFVANVGVGALMLLTVGVDGHRRVEQRWHPRLKQLEELAGADPAEMSEVELRRHVDRLLGALGWWWIEISFFASVVRVCQQLIGVRAGVPDPGALFRGNDSLLLESERELRRVARNEGGVDEYLARFGHTTESADPIHPTLAESPEAQRSLIAAAAADPEGPDGRLARLRAARTTGEAAILTEKGVRGSVARRALAAGQSHAAHTDDAVFHFERLLALIRGAFLVRGRRLANVGVLARDEDVFFLALDELWTSDVDRRELVHSRRVVRNRQKQLSPPPMIPAADDPSWLNDRVMRMMPPEMRAQLLDRGLRSTEGRQVVVGTPASPGIVRGVARVIRGPEEFGRFRPGEVLVAHATSPMWTPLFAVAAAAVTEVGGPFAHAAIVAREFGIPLVDGALDATRSIPDGATVVVNGSAGTVDLP